MTTERVTKVFYISFTSKLLSISSYILLALMLVNCSFHIDMSIEKQIILDFKAFKAFILAFLASETI